jgi:hypothetical protein
MRRSTVLSLLLQLEFPGFISYMTHQSLNIHEDIQKCSNMIQSHKETFVQEYSILFDGYTTSYYWVILCTGVKWSSLPKYERVYSNFEDIRGE